MNLECPSRRFHARAERKVKKTRNGMGNTTSAACRCLRTGCFADVFETTIFFTVFLNQSPSHEILQFLVSTKTKHFFATADRVAGLEVLIHHLEKVVKPEGLLIGKYRYQFVCDVIWYPS